MQKYKQGQKCKWKVEGDYINVYDLYELRNVFENLEYKVKWYMIKKRIKLLINELI